MLEALKEYWGWEAWRKIVSVVPTKSNTQVPYLHAWEYQDSIFLQMVTLYFASVGC